MKQVVRWNEHDIEFLFVSDFRLPSATDELNLYVRWVDANNGTFLALADNDMRIAKKVAGVWTDLATNTGVGLSTGTWYSVRVLCDGANVKVWLGEDGSGMELILETSAAPTTSPARLVLQAPENKTIHVDDIQVIGVTTTYAYDAWGRMTAKSAGTASASYHYHYAYFMTKATSTFSGEGTVSYQVGADGSRRQRDQSKSPLADGEYVPYGTDYAASGTGMHRKFAGYEWDAASNAYATVSRFYDPAGGRWQTRDPRHMFNGPNLYSYALNRPTAFTDPLGLHVPMPNFYQTDADYYSQWSQRPLSQCGHSSSHWLPWVLPVGPALRGLAGLEARAARGLGRLFGGSRWGGQALPRAANPVPPTPSRVVPGMQNLSTLGRPSAPDVFVTAADDIQGLTASQIGPRLEIPSSESFTVITFPTPSRGVASPVFGTNPGFVPGGLTSGGAREFVIPNGPIPGGATITWICK